MSAYRSIKHRGALVLRLFMLLALMVLLAGCRTTKGHEGPPQALVAPDCHATGKSFSRHADCPPLTKSSARKPANLGRNSKDLRVRLRSKVGGLEFAGQLMSFDGSKYIIVSSQFGRLELAADQFNCISENCARIPN